MPFRLMFSNTIIIVPVSYTHLGEQVGTGAQELTHVAVIGQVQPVVPVILLPLIHI